MSPAQAALHRRIDDHATFDADTIEPRELFALGEALAILEGDQTCKP